MADSPNLELPYLVEGQASGEITHNEALNKIDSLVMGGIKDRDLVDPPGAPSNGDRYLVGGVGINGWAGHDDELAIYYDGWVFIAPAEGWTLWVDDENIQILYDGARWTPTIAHARKESTESVNNGGTGTTFQDDDDLLFSMGAFEIWQCHAMLIIQDASAGQAAGFKFKWTAPAVATVCGAYIQLDDGGKDVIEAGAIAGNNSVSLSLPDGNEHHLQMQFMVITDSVVGDLQLEWAQVVADAGNVSVFGTAQYSSHLYGIRAGYGVPLS